MNDYLKNIKVDNVLNEKQNRYCDSEITLTEFNDALNGTKKETAQVQMV